MRQRLSLLAAVCLSTALTLPQLHAQRAPTAKPPTTFTVGQRAADDTPLPATRYPAGGYIESWAVDSASETLTLYARATDRKQRRFKPKGHVVQFDTRAEEVL